ncbi:MAG: 1,4-alpha-glucan branching protein GlgB [Ignavibacteria bacterium]|nr:1,4-alpha-glucan branching protein GlgB [Ignavibacteria bacterium]
MDEDRLKDIINERKKQISEEIKISLSESLEASQKSGETGHKLTDFDIHLFSKGTYYKIFEKFGAQITSENCKEGVRFTVWAPNAESVCVIGEFNGWREEINHLEKISDHGIWSGFIEGLKEGDTYKYSFKTHGTYLRKIDPFAFRSEVRPKDASIIYNINSYEWKDMDWMEKRKNFRYKESPISIYELHLGSWKKDYSKNEWGFMSYGELAHKIVDYVKSMGYTHIELLPVMEHPLDVSWGYQVTHYYAPTTRYGEPRDFMYFIDYCHRNGIGVILDWVPAHFPADDHGLAFFDGKQIYAYENWKKGFHKDWNTYVFDYSRPQVQNFLISSALFWLEKYHADGLRVDAVASMLYLDYSRKHGEWEPNIYGGRENLEAIEFLKHLNDVIHKYHPDVMMIAEESTAYPKVSHPVSEGGLGFDMKWNMGWMNDILLYFSKDPIHRKYHQGKITFSLWYAFSENFILPVSHDEVVHGKKSLIEKMPGDQWQKFANLRLFLGFMFAHPGKKLNFMTTDIAQFNEWNSESSIEWETLETNELNRKLNKYFLDLNHLYRKNKAFHELDFTSDGFMWIDFSDSLNSVLSFCRFSRNRKQILLFTFNMTPKPRYDYPVGVPEHGFWKEIFNSDAEIYGGSSLGNLGGKHSEEIPLNDWNYSLKLTLPPLAVNVYELIKDYEEDVSVGDEFDELYIDAGGD